MATFGDINFRLAKEFPGVDPDIRRGVINDRYTQILDRLPWSRLDVEQVIQTVPQYTTGTIATTNTGTALVLTGGAFTPAMDGYQIHLDGRTEAYRFTYVDAANATIDRPYEGTTNPTAGFVLSQSIYALPASCRIIRSIRNLSLPVPVTKRDRALGDFTDPARILVGPPVRWNDWADGTAVPPPPQVEFWPAPDRVYSMLVSFTAEVTPFGAADTSVAFAIWARPSALMAGCRADLAMLPSNPNLALGQMSEGLFEKRVAEMVNNESRKQGGQQMTAQPAYTRHRLRRWTQTYRDLREVL